MRTAAAKAQELDEWLPKAEAAELLGTKPRQLERRSQQGYIQTRYAERLPTETQARALFNTADILALKTGKPNVHAVPVNDGPIPGLAPKGGELRIPGRQLQIAAHATPPRSLQMEPLMPGIWQWPPHEAPRAIYKPWLTLSEAAEYSGLPKGYLLEQAEAAQDADVDADHGIVVINVGTRKHRVWRFRRDSLGGAK